MNLSPEWEKIMGPHCEAIHWSRIGKPDADDTEILQWALKNQSIVLTSDLDFGDILAATNLNGPSVIQLRSQVLDPEVIGKQVSEVIENHKSALSEVTGLKVDLVMRSALKPRLGTRIVSEVVPVSASS